MITLDGVIQWVTEEYPHLIFGSQLCVDDLKAYEAVMTILSTLDYAKLLEDKFGSLEEALYAEKVEGRWIVRQDESYTCSECGKVHRYEVGHFCSECGTRLIYEE